MAYRRLERADVQLLEECLEGVLSNPSGTTSWSFIDKCIKACAGVIWIAHDFPHCIDVTKAESVGGSGTIQRFFNETVNYITGSSRTLQIESWLGIINEVCVAGDVANTKVGNIGTSMTFKPKEMFAINTQGIAHSGISLNLQNMTHDAILYKWLMRPAGLVDAVLTLRCMVLIYQHFYSDSENDVVTSNSTQS